jgi:hypothetical protein
MARTQPFGAQLPPLVQPEEEEPEDPYFFVEAEDGAILEVYSDGELGSPRAPPSPAAVEVPPPAAPAAPAAPVTPEDPTPVAAGGDSDDFDDDTEGGDETEDDNEEEDDNYYEGPREGDPYCIMHSSEVAPGFFPWLLQNTLLELGNTVYPMYVTHSWNEPPLGNYYMTRVHIRVRNHTGGGYISRTTYDSTTPHSTYQASVSNAARRALFSLRFRHDQELSLSDYRYIPRHTSGTEQTVVPLTGFEDPRLHTLAQVTAALNTNLEGTTSELEQTHGELKDAHARIAELEAECDGREPPVQPDETPFPAESPPRKRLRYGSSSATTGLLG